MKIPPSSTLTQIALVGGLVAAGGDAARARFIYYNTPVTLAANDPSGSIQFNLATGAYGTGSAGIANPQFQISYSGQNTGKPQLQGLSSSPFSQVLYVGSGNEYVKNVPGPLTSLPPAIRPEDGTYGNGINHQPYLSFANDASSQFKQGVQGYAGLHIADPTVPGQIDYGIAAITINNDGSVMLSSFGYDNAGIAPEPSPLVISLLAGGGAAGAAFARHRRLTKGLAA